jgi:hypothetical protein
MRATATPFDECRKTHTHAHKQASSSSSSSSSFVCAPSFPLKNKERGRLILHSREFINLLHKESFARSRFECYNKFSRGRGKKEEGKKSGRSKRRRSRRRRRKPTATSRGAGALSF